MSILSRKSPLIQETLCKYSNKTSKIKQKNTVCSRINFGSSLVYRPDMNRT